MSNRWMLPLRCAGLVACGSLAACGMFGGDRSDRLDRSAGGSGAAAAASAPSPVMAPPVTVQAVGDTVTVDDGRSGSPIELRLDQQLVVRLHYEFSSTAQWELTDFTPGPLAAPGPSRFDTRSGEGAMELGGDQIWRFRPTGPGQTTLNFAYRMPRSREAASRTATFAVTVRR